MFIVCTHCGKKSIFNRNTIKSFIGASAIGVGVWGWVTYAFVGILGFYGGAALIAGSFVVAGTAVLSRENSTLISKIAKGLPWVLNRAKMKCPSCKESDWLFYKEEVESNEVIHGKQHIAELDHALNTANYELIIVSGFISTYVVDAIFLAKLAKLLDKRVRVCLIYPDISRHNSNDWMYKGFKEADYALKQLASRYPKLELMNSKTHQKTIIVDRSYAIVGSYNFLMNATAERNEEASVKFHDQGTIQGLIKELNV
ncbi:phospholipase D-like domain-containing protein [Vibrio breoganii]